jgi:hypothetical protein
MKKIFLLLLAFVLLSGTCERDDIPTTNDCNCIIEGINQISFDGGHTWLYSGKDERSGMLYPCSYSGTYTNQYTGVDGVKKRIYWECKK